MLRRIRLAKANLNAIETITSELQQEPQFRNNFQQHQQQQQWEQQPQCWNNVQQQLQQQQHQQQNRKTSCSTLLES